MSFVTRLGFGQSKSHLCQYGRLEHNAVVFRISLVFDFMQVHSIPNRDPAQFGDGHDSSSDRKIFTIVELKAIEGVHWTKYVDIVTVTISDAKPALQSNISQWVPKLDRIRPLMALAVAGNDIISALP